MRDTVTFINSIKYENFVNDVTTFFDEIMCLYNIVGEYSFIINIDSMVDNEQSCVSFLLQFNNERDRDIINTTLSERYACIFGRKFNIEQTVEGNNILIKFK